MMAASDAGVLTTGEPLFQRLSRCRELPSPPSIVLKILELSEDPNADAEDFARVLSRDPALVAKVLRIANSPLYGQRRRVESLLQAVFIIGVDGTITLALSFSLIPELQNGGQGSLNYDLYWRRSLLAGVCARVLAKFLRFPAQEEVLLGALLQDIGMLVLDKAVSGFYAGLGNAQADHAAVIRYETERLGMDHAAVGAWLLDSWNLPARLQAAVEASHAPLTEGSGARDEARRYGELVIVAGKIADLWLLPDDENRYREALAAIDTLGVTKDSVNELLDAISAFIPEVESAYDWPLGDAVTNELIIDRAKEMTLMRNLSALKNAADLQGKAQALERHSRQLEEENRKDGLTALYNRAYFDKSVASEFTRAKQGGWPLSIAFVDLDRFKSVNDTYGHQSGDAVLTKVAALLRKNCRETDVLARYGGEELVMLMPGAALDGASSAANRILDALRSHSHPVGRGCCICVTASIGVAIQSQAHDYGSAEALVRAADRALYAAKQAGRDRAEVAAYKD